MVRVLKIAKNQIFLKTCIVFLFAPCLKAQVVIPSVELQGTEQHSFQTENGTKFDLYISFPIGYNPENEEIYPVLYITDAKNYFPLYFSTYQSLFLGREVRPLILVGIDSPVSSIAEYRALRTLNLTPTQDREEEQERSVEYGQEVITGGAGNFLKVLEGEIVPWVEGRFSVSDERGLAGYSLGGLFATYVFLQSPGTFQNYLIGSPSLWWDNEVMFEIEEAFNVNSLTTATHLYFSAGTEEGMMLPLMLRFSETLKDRNYENLTLESQIFNDETHFSGIPATISRGLVQLYGN